MTGLRQLAILAFLCAPMLQAMPVLGVSSSQFVFGVAPGSNPFPQNFRIFNKGDGTLNVAASVPSNFPWLNVSLSSGSGSVSINSTTLAVGIYAGTFTLSDPSAADSPRTMSVTLNVTRQLVTIPTTLAVFVTPQTATFRDIYLPLQSIPTGNIPAFQATTVSGGNWLSTKLVAEGGGVFARAYIAPLAEGNYSGAFNFVLHGQTIGQVPIALVVTSRAILALSQSSVAVETTTGLEVPDQLIQVSNVGLGALNWTPASDSPWMTAVQDGSSLRISFSSGSLTPGVYQGNVTIASNTAANAPQTVPVTLTMNARGAPTVKVGGAVDGANYCIRENCYLAPGSLVSLFGSQLAYQTAAATALPLPNKLGTTQILVNGSPVELLYVSYSQVNFRLPTAPPTAAKWIIVAQRDGQSSKPVSAPYTSTAPTIFTANQSGQGYGAILLAGKGILADNNNPAARGSFVEIYTTGLGVANIPPPTVIFSGLGILGNVEAPPTYAGPAPGFVGLYQINVQIPTAVPATNHLRVQIRTAYNLLSNAAEIAVK